MWKALVSQTTAEEEEEEEVAEEEAPMEEPETVEVTIKRGDDQGDIFAS